MSYEVFGDNDDDFGFTEDRAEELQAEAFIAGLQAMREMLARFVEQGGDHTTANSIRLNWNPSWGTDPGRPADVFVDHNGTTQAYLNETLEIIAKKRDETSVS